MSRPIHYAENAFGFDYGAAEVQRVCSDAAKGWVVLSIHTPKSRLQVYVTKTGKVRVYKDGKEMH